MDWGNVSIPAQDWHWKDWLLRRFWMRERLLQTSQAKVLEPMLR